MNSFGLGLVLSFVDNASSGLRGAMMTFQQLSATADSMSSSLTHSVNDVLAASYALDATGDVLISTGSSILSMFAAVSKSVIDTGMTMQGYRMQLAALYGSTEEGEAKLNEIKQYAMSSIFDIQSLIPAVTSMKAVGIEAMEEITTSSGEHTQRLLDYASDIAAMVPNMRNTYGTGVQAAMGSLKEYIAEGNALSLKRNAGLDITSILGEEKGSSIEERTQQVADLVEKLNIVGYTAQLAGTPTQRLSNLEDAWFNTLTKIADSGVFEAYCSLLERASNWIFDLVNNEENFNAITSILAETLTTILSPLEALLDIVIFIGDRLVDLIKNNPKVAKTILVVVAAIGAALVAGGAFLKLMASLGMASVGLNALKSLRDIFKLLGVIIPSVLGKLLPFIAIAFLIYEAWTHNLFGIRDAATKIFSDIGTIISLCFDAWSDNELSEENFIKARDLGILPLIEAILDLKYKWDFFIEGFKQGFESVFTYLDTIIGKIAPVGSSVYDLANKVGLFLKSLFGVQGTEDAWKNVGDAVGKVVAILVIGIPIVLTVIKVFSAIASVVGIIIKVASAFAKVWGVIKIVIGAVASLLGVSFGWAAAIVAAVVAVVALIIAYWDEIKAVLSVVGEWIYSNIIVPVVNFFIDALNFIVGLVATIWEGIVSILSVVGSWVYSNIISPVVDFVTQLFATISEIVTNIWNAIVAILTPVANWVNDNIITPVVNFFTTLIDSISGIFSSVYDAIVGAFQSAYDVVVGIWNGVVDFFSGIASRVSSFISGITSKGSSITGLSGIPAAAQGVDNFVGGLIQINEKGGELITLPSGSTVIPHDESIEDSFHKGMLLGAKAMVPSRTQAPTTVQDTKNDYSITFSAGSIVIQLKNASDAELEKAGEKLMKIIERKQQLRRMAVRTSTV